MSDLDYAPPVYWWLAEYAGGEALPQFDPESGCENPYASVDQRRLVGFGWYPFTAEFSERIYHKTGIITTPSSNSIHRVEVLPGERLRASRRNTVHVYTYYRCEVCGCEWQLGVKEPRVGLPVSEEVYEEQIPQGDKMIRWVNAVCPGCGYHDVNEIGREAKRIRAYMGMKRETEYLLGTDSVPTQIIREDGSIGER